MNTKLVLLDGIPGSGKSTTSDFIHRQLEASGIRASWFHELEEANPLFNEEYIRTRTIDDPISYIEDTLKKWSYLTREIQTMDMVYIIDGYLLQATVGCMFDNNVRRDLILEYSRKVSEIIEPLQPRIIYFSPTDVRKNLLNLRNVRDDEWIKSRGESLKECKYALANELEGFEGWVTMLSERANLADTILQSYAFPKLVLDSTEGDWIAYRKKVCEFLEIEQVDEKKPTMDEITMLEGRYQLQGSDYICRISSDDQNLFLHDFFASERKLIPVRTKYFEVEAVASSLSVVSVHNNLAKEILIDMTRLFEGDTFNLRRVR